MLLAYPEGFVTAIFARPLLHSYAYRRQYAKPRRVNVPLARPLIPPFESLLINIKKEKYP
jgi:hypothetical protein